MFAKNDIKPFENKIWLSTPTMHGEELEYIHDAFDKNWVTTSGDNITALESLTAAYLNDKNNINYESDGGGKLYTVGLSSGTAAIHLALKLAGLKINPGAKFTDGLLRGHRVFVSDMTFNATVNPILYEGGKPVFIDSEYETWNMDPQALERAFELYPEVRIVVVVNLYGTSAQLHKLREVCDAHNAVLIEDAAESLGAFITSMVKGKGYQRQTGTFGDYNVISYNGNKIITGSAGGMLITTDRFAAERVRKWSTQAREQAPWYQHEELGYNYRISNIIAGIVRGQMEHLDAHIEAKRRIYERYKSAFKDLPVKMNPHMREAEPNYWLSCITVNPEVMCRQVRSEREVLYIPERGRSCPTEILETLARFNAEGRPIWKPIHLQPLYRSSPFVTKDGEGRASTDAYIEHTRYVVDEDIFDRGLCLPSDIKMKEWEQDKVIEVVRSCFD